MIFTWNYYYFFWFCSAKFQPQNSLSAAISLPQSHLSSPASVHTDWQLQVHWERTEHHFAKYTPPATQFLLLLFLKALPLFPTNMQLPIPCSEISYFILSRKAMVSFAMEHLAIGLLFTHLSPDPSIFDQHDPQHLSLAERTASKQHQSDRAHSQSSRQCKTAR